MLQGYLPQLLQGLKITVLLALCALFLGLLLGLVGAIFESAKYRALRYFFISLNSVIRGVPELIVIFFIYFASASLLNNIFHQSPQTSAFIAGVIALGLIFSSYASQTLRGAFLAIPRGQVEAAYAIGLNRWQTFYYIMLPQAWRYALPGLGNLWLALIKDTALVSLIGLTDLMAKSQIAAISTAKPFIFYLVAGVIYLLLTSVSEIILRAAYWRMQKTG